MRRMGLPARSFLLRNDVVGVNIATAEIPPVFLAIRLREIFQPHHPAISSLVPRGYRRLPSPFTMTLEPLGKDQRVFHLSLILAFRSRSFFRATCFSVGSLSDRGRKGLSPSPPSEPCVRFSRTRLSSRWFPHRDWLASFQAVCMVNSPWAAKNLVGQR